MFLAAKFEMFIECFRGRHRGGAQFYFIFAVLWALFSCLFYLRGKVSARLRVASPGNPLLRVSVSGRYVCELALRVCDNVCYCVMVLSCLQDVPLAV